MVLKQISSFTFRTSLKAVSDYHVHKPLIGQKSMERGLTLVSRIMPRVFFHARDMLLSLLSDYLISISHSVMADSF